MFSKTKKQKTEKCFQMTGTKLFLNTYMPCADEGAAAVGQRAPSGGSTARPPVWRTGCAPLSGGARAPRHLPREGPSRHSASSTVPFPELPHSNLALGEHTSPRGSGEQVSRRPPGGDGNKDNARGGQGATPAPGRGSAHGPLPGSGAGPAPRPPPRPWPSSRRRRPDQPAAAAPSPRRPAPPRPHPPGRAAAPPASGSAPAGRGTGAAEPGARERGAGGWRREERSGRSRPGPSVAPGSSPFTLPKVPTPSVSPRM